MSDIYKVKIGGVVADPYRIAMAYGLDPILSQGLKKLLRCGRKHKDAKTDIREVITTMERWLEIQDDIEREESIESLRYVPSVPNAVLASSTYAGLTQEQIADRNRQCADAAAVGIKTKMEEILDSKETTWP
jgi:hypothetical protein